MTTPSDADLTAIIDAATPGEWDDINPLDADQFAMVVAIKNGKQIACECDVADATFIATCNPQMVASLLARAQAAEAKATSIAIDAGLRIGDAQARYEIAHESFMLSQSDCDRLRAQLAAAEAKLRAVEALADSLTEQGDHHVPGCMGQADCAACVQHDLRAAIGGGSE